MTSKKNRNFSCVLYGNVTNLNEFLKSAEYVPRQYAYIVHDKDIKDNGEVKKTHIHLILCYENARSLESVEKGLIKYMSIGEENLQNAFIEPCRDLKGAYGYLIHKNEPNKYQYSESDIVCSSSDYFTHVSSTNDYISVIMDFIDKQDRIVTYSELVRHFGNLIAFTRINWIQVVKEHNEMRTLFNDYGVIKSENKELKEHNHQLQSDILDLILKDKEG